MLRVGDIERLQLESVGWSPVRLGPQRMEGSAGRKRPGACNLLPAMEGKMTSLHWTRYTGGMMLVWRTQLNTINIVSVFSAYEFNSSSAGGSAGSDFNVLYGWYFDFFAPARVLLGLSMPSNSTVFGRFPAYKSKS